MLNKEEVIKALSGLALARQILYKEISEIEELMERLNNGGISREMKIIGLLSLRGPMKIHELAKLMKTDWTTIAHPLYKLVNDNKVKKEENIFSLM